MTLTEKFLQLSVTQRKIISSIANEKDLSDYINEQGIIMTNQEKTQLLEYFNKGMFPLEDDDLDVAAGGTDKPTAGNCPNCSSSNTRRRNDAQCNKCNDCGHEWR